MDSLVKVSLAALLLVATHAHTPHRICVPESALKACQKMVEQGKTVGVNLECVAARDRMECMNKVFDHTADFEVVDPEDMYLAARMSNPDFTIFKEIRTKEEPTAEFRYEAVAVIHKDMEMKSLENLRGLRSCHTGVGRNVGYKVPIAKLSKIGLLTGLNDSSLSPRENELKALSGFFSKACLVGKWSPHPETNQKLKQKYNNLCELCEHPDKCDYPDANSGYEGALKCLATAGGQVAWTKVIFVKKFFGMPYGLQPAAKSEFKPEDYAYLCPDATKKPITGTPCTWAARPWPGYMANQQLSGEVKELRDEVAKLNEFGESTHADWIASVLALNNKTIAKDNAAPVQPMAHLEKAKYVDVIERGQGRKVVLCTHGAGAAAKCDYLYRGAYSRDIRPELECVRKDTPKQCMEAIKSGEAEIVVLDPHQAITAEESYNLKPLVIEKYTGSDTQQFLAVVKKGSSYQKLADLKGKKACVQPNGYAGYTATVKALLDAGLIPHDHCPHEKSLGEFFSAGLTSSDDPMGCLHKGEGDVAFVPYSALHATGDEVEVLCSAGRKPYSEAPNCFLTTLPPQMVMSSSKLSEVELDDVRFSLLAAGDLYAKRPDLFLMFGPFQGHSNVIFSDHAVGLVAVADVVPSYEAYKKSVKELGTCKV